MADFRSNDNPNKDMSQENTMPADEYAKHHQNPFTATDKEVCANTKETPSEPTPSANTLKELYLARRNGHLSIWGTALAWYSAFWEFFLIHILWGKIPKPIILLYRYWHKSNGYALVLYSTLIWIWWGLSTVILLANLALLVIYCVAWFCALLITSAPYPLIAIYTLIYELPASVLNRDFGNMNEADKYYNLWGNASLKIALAVGSIVGLFAGLVVGFEVSPLSGLVAFTGAFIVSTLFVYAVEEC
jgi:hypothetical protein